MGVEFVTCKKASEMTGMPQEVFRAGCHRAPGMHPLPHIKCGGKRPVLRIEVSDLKKWLEEEARLTAEKGA